MSSNHFYETAYEHATSEIAEIDAQIERLTRRKELLEKLLEPLKLLVPELAIAAVHAKVSDGSNSEFSAPNAATLAPSVVLVEAPQVEPGPFEAPDPVIQPTIEETNAHIGSGRPISDEDIAGLAYRLWNERGRIHGHHEEDWFRAAQELQNSA